MKTKDFAEILREMADRLEKFSGDTTINTREIKVWFENRNDLIIEIPVSSDGSNENVWHRYLKFLDR